MHETTKGAWVHYDDVESLLANEPPLGEASPKMGKKSRHWERQGKQGGYFIWRAIAVGGLVGAQFVYQATIANVPPQSDSGYFNLDALLKLKGVKV